MIATPLTLLQAYAKGRRATGDDMQDSRMRFVTKYCQHEPWSSCDLCIAWHNGYDDQIELERAEHAKKCSRGLADRGNHEDCCFKPLSCD